MEQYAGQVEEYMKKCFPNVRGRGRPIHTNGDRQSPNSPVSPQNGQTSASRRGSINNSPPNASNNVNFPIIILFT